MDKQNEAHHRQQVRLAIEAGQHWGMARPRRWLAHYGGVTAAKGFDAAALNTEYNKVRKAIAAKVPASRISEAG